MRRLALLLASILLLPGCHAWEPLDDPNELTSGVGDVRVRTTDGVRITLEDVRVRGDTLYTEESACRWTLALGRAPGGRAWCGGAAVARADVVSAEVRVDHGVRTNLLIVGIGFLWGAVMIALLELLSDARGDRPRSRTRVRPASGEMEAAGGTSGR